MAELSTRDVIDLLERASRAEITLGDLDELWPEEPTDPLLAEIRRDLEFALEHMPGWWRKPGVDLRSWQAMPEYEDIQIRIKHLRQVLLAEGR